MMPGLGGLRHARLVECIRPDTNYSKLPTLTIKFCGIAQPVIYLLIVQTVQTCPGRLTQFKTCQAIILVNEVHRKSYDIYSTDHMNPAVLREIIRGMSTSTNLFDELKL